MFIKNTQVFKQTHIDMFSVIQGGGTIPFIILVL